MPARDAIGGQQLVISPVTATGAPLSEADAASVYGFAQQHAALKLAGVGKTTTAQAAAGAVLPFLAGL